MGRRGNAALPDDRLDLVGLGMGCFFIFYGGVWGVIGVKNQL